MAVDFLKVRTGLNLRPNAAPGSPENGDIYYDSGSNLFKFYQNGAFVTIPSSVVSTVGTYDSQSASADGLVIVGTSIYAQSATASFPGMVNTTTQAFAGAKTFNTSLATPSFLLKGATSGAITMSTPATVSSYSLVWPGSQGGASTFLQNDGSGNLSWVTATTGANTALSNLASVAINISLLPGTDNAIDVGSAAKRFANVHGLNHLIYGSTSGAITLAAANTTSSYTVKWPSSQGGATTFLQNDGSGNLSWATATAGANTALSNLAAVAINTALLPGTDNTLDFGSPTFRWTNLHSLVSTLYGSTSGAITIEAADTTTPYIIKWPNAQAAAAGYVLSNDGSGNLSWVTAPTIVPKWTRVILTFASFSTAGTTNDISLVVLPTKTMLHQVIIKHSAPAAGAGLTAYTLSVGQATNFTQYSQPFDVKQAVTNIARSITQIDEVPNFTGTQDIRIQAISAGANLNGLTAGTFDVWYLTSTLP